MQKEFAEQARLAVAKDENVIGLAVGGSWLTGAIDEYSDLDLVLVTREKVAGNRPEMLAYAARLGNLLTGFTGEHVGEPRLLICLFDKPLLHVDIKFLTLDELEVRVEDPHILFDRDNQLKDAFESSTAAYPLPDFQWIENRFWTWVHYALLKIGRGEYLEAFDFLGYLRMVVLGPLLHMKNGELPRGVRKLEATLPEKDLEQVKATLPQYHRTSILNALQNCVSLYRDLRSELFPESIALGKPTEEKVMQYFADISSQ